MADDLQGSSPSTSLTFSKLLRDVRLDDSSLLSSLAARLRTCRDPSAVYLAASGKRPTALYPLQSKDMLSLLYQSLGADYAIPSVFFGQTRAPKPSQVIRFAWLTDTIIDNFLTIAATYANQGISMRAWRTLGSHNSGTWNNRQDEIKANIQRGLDGKKTHQALDDSLRSSWKGLRFNSNAEFFSSCKGILLPFHHNRNHWTLIHISVQDRCIQVMDSQRRQSRSEFMFALALLQVGLGSDFQLADWTLSEVKTRQQKDEINCGVFVCLNALALCQGREPFVYLDTTDTPGLLLAAREYIAACLMQRMIVTGVSGTAQNPIVV